MAPSSGTNKINVDYTKQINDISDRLKLIRLTTEEFINNPENLNELKTLTEKNRMIYNNVLTSQQEQIATLRNQLAKIEYYVTVTPPFVDAKTRETLELIQLTYILSQDVDNLIQKAYLSPIKPRFVGENKAPTSYQSIIVYFVLMIIALTLSILYGAYKN